MSGSFDPAIHVPGVWRCAKCQFVLIQSNLNAGDGTVTARDEAGDKCPNDGSPLWRVTWQQQAEEMALRCEEAIVEEARVRKLLATIKLVCVTWKNGPNALARIMTLARRAGIKESLGQGLEEVADQELADETKMRVISCNPSISSSVDG